MLLNANDNTAQTVAVTWEQLGWPASANVTVYDLWQHSVVGAFTAGYSAEVAIHGNAFVRVTRNN